MSDFREDLEAALQVVEEACDSLATFDPEWWRKMATARGYREHRIISAAYTLMLELDRLHQENMTGPYGPIDQDERVPWDDMTMKEFKEYFRSGKISPIARRPNPFLQHRDQPPPKRYRGFDKDGKPI